MFREKQKETMHSICLRNVNFELLACQNQLNGNF